MLATYSRSISQGRQHVIDCLGAWFEDARINLGHRRSHGGELTILFQSRTRWWKRFRDTALCVAISLLAGCSISESPPLAAFSWGYPAGTLPLTVEFDARTAYDPDGEIADYLMGIRRRKHRLRMRSLAYLYIFRSLLGSPYRHRQRRTH